MRGVKKKVPTKEKKNKQLRIVVDKYYLSPRYICYSCLPNFDQGSDGILIRGLIGQLMSGIEREDNSSLIITLNFSYYYLRTGSHCDPFQLIIIKS